jgi:hypothetical protein
MLAGFNIDPDVMMPGSGPDLIIRGRKPDV